MRVLVVLYASVMRFCYYCFEACLDYQPMRTTTAVDCVVQACLECRWPKGIPPLTIPHTCLWKFTVQANISERTYLLISWTPRCPYVRRHSVAHCWAVPDLFALWLRLCAWLISTSFSMKFSAISATGKSHIDNCSGLKMNVFMVSAFSLKLKYGWAISHRLVG